MWIIADAQKVATDLNDLVVKANCHIGLAGSVLFSGRSHNDLDLVILPLNPPFGPPDYAQALELVKTYFRASSNHDGEWQGQQLHVNPSVETCVPGRTTDFYRFFYQEDKIVDIIIVRKEPSV